MSKKQIENKKFIIIIIFILIFIDQILKLSFRVEHYETQNNSNLMNIATNLIVIIIGVQFINSNNQFVEGKTKLAIVFLIAGGIANIIDLIFRKLSVKNIVIGNLSIINLASIYVLIGWIFMAAIFAVFTVNQYREKRK